MHIIYKHHYLKLGQQNEPQMRYAVRSEIACLYFAKATYVCQLTLGICYIYLSG